MHKEEIGLQDLIYQVKSELLAPNPAQKAKDPYPLFAIDKVELEIAVDVKRVGQAGLKLTVLEFGTEIGGSISRERGHTVKVSLAPILTPDELRQMLIQEDPRVKDAIGKRSRQAFLKGE